MSDYVSTSMGRVGFALPAPYAETIGYQKRDIVQFQGSSFVVLQDNVQGVIPSDDGVYYRMLAGRGEPGASNARWFTGAAVTGTGTGIVATVPGSAAGDMYLNSETGNVYQAQAADTWDWVANVIGPTVSVNGEEQVDGEIALPAAKVPATNPFAGLVLPDNPSVQDLLNALPDVLDAVILEKDKKKYPVGTLLPNVSGQNPGEYLGFGTWEAWGAGRVPVGYNGADTDFNEAEKTGGAKTQLIAQANLPNLSLEVIIPGTLGGTLHRLCGDYVSSPGSQAAHPAVLQDYVAANTAYVSTGGGNQPLNNMPPYITCYIWKRIA